MRFEVLQDLVSPTSRAPLEIRDIAEEADDCIRNAELIDTASGEKYYIRDFILRTADDGNYAKSFGEQWNRYRRTQIDRFNGTTCSSDRFYAGTQWSPEELKDQKILEIGCGAGRFTQVLLDAGAQVYSLDYSGAVDACWANNSPNSRLTVVQADVYALPFKHGFFDKVFCFGVLQHTPDVKRSFMSLAPFLKPGGKIAIDCYRKVPWIYPWTSKYLYRGITKRMSRERLRRIIEAYVPRWIPVANRIKRIPVLRRVVPALVPCWNYTGLLPLTKQQIIEWGILDTFDALSPRYDKPQTIPQILAWFKEAGFEDISVGPGANGLVGTGRKP